MSTETAPQPPKKQASPTIAKEDGAIAVKQLKFVSATDVPGKEVALSLTGGGNANQSHWLIDYLPNQRHFRVVFNTPNRASVTGFVHETRVNSWIRGE